MFEPNSILGVKSIENVRGIRESPPSNGIEGLGLVVLCICVPNSLEKLSFIYNNV